MKSMFMMTADEIADHRQSKPIFVAKLRRPSRVHDGRWVFADICETSRENLETTVCRVMREDPFWEIREFEELKAKDIGGPDDGG